MRFSDYSSALASAIRHPGIGRQVLVSILLFSSLVTLVATALQLYTDYRRDIGIIENRLEDIDSSYLASLSASLWNLDVNQLQIQLEGISHLPDIHSVSVREIQEQISNPLELSLGTLRESQHITREYPIYHEAGTEQRQIGILVVQDRKSTRLNSSHVAISYAVFCLKKRKQ